MLTLDKEYYSLYHRIQSQNPPGLAILVPGNEKIYSIDLNTRTIESPEYLSLEKDHEAEIIYFLVDRFYDSYDLSQAVCVVEFINAKGEPRTYPIPYYDIYTFKKDNKMLVPWVIDQEVTKLSGNVSYAFRFYKLTDSGKFFIYNLSTLPATSKILSNIGFIEDEKIIVGKISPESFNSYRQANIDLYTKEENEYILTEVYIEGEKYYINPKNAFLASVEQRLDKKLADMTRTDIFWEESINFF